MRPTAGAMTARSLVVRPVPTVLVVSAGCLVTAATGLYIIRLRTYGGSLLTPVLLHVSTRCLGPVSVGAVNLLELDQPA